MLARLGREHEALQRLEQARSAYASLHRYLAVADCEEHIGYALLALDRPGAAVEHLSHARALHDEAGRTDHVAACEAGLSAASGQRERPRPALDLPRVAPPLRARLSGWRLTSASSAQAGSASSRAIVARKRAAGCAVDGAVIERRREADGLAQRADGQDRRLRRQHERLEAVDAERPEVGDAERAGEDLLGAQRARAGRLGEPQPLRREPLERARVGVEDDRHGEARRRARARARC